MVDKTLPETEEFFLNQMEFLRNSSIKTENLKMVKKMLPGTEAIFLNLSSEQKTGNGTIRAIPAGILLRAV